jgi:hypothetical protein
VVVSNQGVNLGIRTADLEVAIAVALDSPLPMLVGIHQIELESELT